MPKIKQSTKGLIKPELESETDRQKTHTDVQIISPLQKHRQTERQTDTQTDKQTHRQTHRQTDTQTDRQTN